MATGTAAGLLAVRSPQSFFKHRLLQYYTEPFSAMVGSTAVDKRVVILDGYAGRGRYDDGQPGSAELIMQTAAAYKRVRIEPVMVESDRKHFEHLKKVAHEYTEIGVHVAARHGKLERHLDQVLEQAEGVPLFMFLDPTGAGMPFDRLASVLNSTRAGEKPPTELLMNFSAEMTRRLGGQVVKDGGMLGNFPKMDAVCGGQWWRRLVREAVAQSPNGKFDLAAERVAHAYAERLAGATSMMPVVVPVHDKVNLQPVYHLVFLTRSVYGLWVMADAIAKARQDWLRALTRGRDDGLFDAEELMNAQLNREQAQAKSTIEENLRRLLHQRSAFRLLPKTSAVLDGVYGVATEKTIELAVLTLVDAGIAEVPNASGTRFRNRAIQRSRGFVDT